MQALQHGVVFPRVARADGRDAVPLQLLRLRAGDHFAYLVHALPAQIEHLVERRIGVRVDAPAARTGEPRSTQAHGWYGWAIPFTIRRSQQSVASTR